MANCPVLFVIWIKMCGETKTATGQLLASFDYNIIEKICITSV